jgi:hypothetical protein
MQRSIAPVAGSLYLLEKQPFTTLPTYRVAFSAEVFRYRQVGPDEEVGYFLPALVV